MRLPSDQQIADTIQAKEDFKSLQQHPGWKRVMKFIESQDEGIIQTFKIGIKPDLVFGKTRIQKYDDMQTELKVYKKMLKFVELTIQNGLKYERRIAQAAQANK